MKNRVQTIRLTKIQLIRNADISAKSIRTIQPIIVIAALAPTCCELVNRGQDSIQNLEPVITAKRWRAPNGDLKLRNNFNSDFFFQS